MYEHLVKNKFWFWKAMETYGLGIYFIIKHNTFAFEPPEKVLQLELDKFQLSLINSQNLSALTIGGFVIHTPSADL